VDRRGSGRRATAAVALEPDRRVPSKSTHPSAAERRAAVCSVMNHLHASR